MNLNIELTKEAHKLLLDLVRRCECPLIVTIRKAIALLDMALTCQQSGGQVVFKTPDQELDPGWHSEILPDIRDL